MTEGPESARCVSGTYVPVVKKARERAATLPAVPIICELMDREPLERPTIRAALFWASA